MTAHARATMRSTAAAVVAFTSLGTVRAQPPDTVGLMLNLPGAYVGYTLFSPLSYTDTYLIDVDGLLGLPVCLSLESDGPGGEGPCSFRLAMP